MIETLHSKEFKKLMAAWTKTKVKPPRVEKEPKIESVDPRKEELLRQKPEP